MSYNKVLDSEWYRVAKLFKRLHIVDAFDKIVYTPPDFLRKFVSREKLDTLAAGFNAEHADYIKLVVAFEKQFGID